MIHSESDPYFVAREIGRVYFLPAAADRYRRWIFHAIDLVRDRFSNRALKVVDIAMAFWEGEVEAEVLLAARRHIIGEIRIANPASDDAALRLAAGGFDAEGFEEIDELLISCIELLIPIGANSKELASLLIKHFPIRIGNKYGS